MELYVVETTQHTVRVWDGKSTDKHGRKITDEYTIHDHSFQVGDTLEMALRLVSRKEKEDDESAST